jgi:hypothetical protein
MATKNKDATRLSPSISNEHKAKFDEIASRLNLKSQGEVIEYLIDIFEDYLMLKEQSDNQHNNDLPLTNDEQQQVQSAMSNSGLTYQEIAKDGLLQRAKYLNSVAKKQSELESLSDADIKENINKLTFKGVADYRIEQAIQKIIDYNETASQNDKICITKGIVFNITGSNRQTINKFFETKQHWIDDHNNKHNLTDKDNRKGKGYDVKAVLGIE